MTARTAITALLTAFTLTTAACSATHHPTARANPARIATSPSTPQSPADAATPPASTTMPAPNPSSATPIAPAHVAPTQIRTTAAPAAHTSIAIPPIVQVSPTAFAVSVTSAPTQVSVPSNGDEWDICIPVTLHITNHTGATITTITVDPDVESRSPGGQLDHLITTSASYTVIHPNISDGHTTDITTKACGYIYNNASQTITYTGTAQMTGGYATDTATQSFFPASSPVVTITTT